MEKLFSAVFPGILAFAGSFLALRAQRKLTRDNWLLQRRSEVFSKFLLDFQQYRNEMMTIDDDDYKSHSFAVEKISTSANLVCLCVPEPDRIEFYNNFNGYLKFKPDFSGVLDAKNVSQIYAPQYQFEKNIQKLFERILSENK